tara:strand:+ start:157 stop:477 length:321 start_codon:yes stop_codon:yes gene_type:complete
MEYHIISASGGQEITGSIVKIYKTPHVSGSPGSGSLTNIDFGRHVEPDSSFTPTTTANDLFINNGDSFECPGGVPCIARAKTVSQGFYFFLIGPSVNTGGTIQSSY